MNDVWTVMKKIVGYYPLTYGTVTALRIFGFAGAGLLSGAAVKLFFDHASASTLTAGRVYEISALLIVIPLVQALLYAVDLHMSYGWTEIIRSIFRRNMFRFVLGQPGAAPLSIGHGQLMNMLRSDVAVPESLMWSIPYFLGYALFSLVGLGMLAAVDWRATAALFAPLLLAVAAMRWLKRRIALYYERQQQTADRYIGLLSEMLRHQETIRVNHAGPAFLERLDALGRERASAGKRNAVLQTGLASVYDHIVNIGTALLLLFMGTRSGGFPLGSFTLFLYFLGYVSGTIRLLGSTAAGFSQSRAVLGRIGALLGDGHIRRLTANDPLYLHREPPEIPAPEPVEPLRRLDVRRLGFAYPGMDAGIRDISFSLPRATITVIAGPIGAGKTTLLRALLGLLPDASGEIAWNGRTVDRPERFFVPPAAAYVPQTPVLFDDTLVGNILLGYPYEERHMADSLRLAMLEDELARFPDGLSTPLGPKGMALSGGQRQRVAVARMAIRRAELWVLDDSSSALDAETESRLWERIDALRRSAGITCLIVSAKPFVLRYADQVIALDNGRIDFAASRLLAPDDRRFI